MTTPRVSTALELRLDEASSPAKVEAAARMFQRMLDAAFPGLPEGSVTMVVTNYQMGAGVRPRTKDARLAVQRVLSFMENPTRALEKNPELWGVADAVVNFHRQARPAVGAHFLRARRKTPLATFSEGFVEVMAKIARGEHHRPGSMQGNTTVVTPVLRVGRAAQDRHVKVRLVLDGKPQDVKVAEGAEAAFYDAAKASAEVEVLLDAVWFRDADDQLWFDHERTVATEIGQVMVTDGSADLLTLLRASAPHIATLSAEEFEQMLAEMGGRA